MCLLTLPFHFQSSEFEELKEKLKKYKNSSTLLKLFKNRQPNMDDDLQVKATKSTKQFKRPSFGEVISQNDTTIVPAVNETIVESKFLFLHCTVRDFTQVRHECYRSIRIQSLKYQFPSLSS